MLLSLPAQAPDADSTPRRRQANHPRGTEGSKTRRSATFVRPSSRAKSVRASTAPIIRAMIVSALSGLVREDREDRVVKRGERECLQCAHAREGAAVRRAEACRRDKEWGIGPAGEDGYGSGG